jgi:hypothetical protein
MAPFFVVAYAAVLFVALAAAGAIPGTLLGLVVPRADRRLLLPAVPLALIGWIWFGWLGGRYGISRLGLVLYAAVAAAGFVRGWQLGLDLGIRARRRQPAG